MQPLTIEELPYCADSAPLFARLLDLEQPVYLDSAAPFSARGRYDIFSAAPVALCETSSSTSPASSKTTFFDELQHSLQQHLPAINNDYHLPFTGGALGFFGYDLSRQLEEIPAFAIQDSTLADASVGIYSWAVVVDHRKRRAVLVAHPHTDLKVLTDIRQRLNSNEGRPDTVDFQLESAFTANLSKTDYRQAFETIQRYISAGDCYQINLAQRFSADFEGSPWQAYQRLRSTAAAPFSAYIQTKNQAILSVSPERFLHLANQRVSTSPIKGTIGRGRTPEQDQQLAQQLLNSAKDRAENLMIVDLLRNDLGKTCKHGSIQVDELFELQSFETVHHLVSTISGQLKKGNTAIDLLASCFPGGSITGAPKVRAMQIIEELEPHRRSAYCGAIGYISCDGQMDTNIAIRTMVCEQNKIHCWAGGGIVADSECESEYQECLTKVEKLLAALA
ncbi:aminodeoxychorismate synthase component I [Oceanicoccus sp. KOV_DT_Chl]|uniref:aminodeoxychorismate synthase component I n=1 Tax=Oceanicoccus sp. KOV_DT_Chl TaxID=1904639 RepID=UPI000C79DDCD|nr:aminodeoxychorismate synthase component I [Oceanicoccus sp. KOV_DT_Chl]